MAFRGWPAEAFDFYEGLEADNTKTYWNANKELYQRAVREPMEALLEQLEPEFGAWRVFRPYRDVRFSADKSPYKTNAAGHTWKDGAVYYVALSADGLFAASGYYMMAKDQVDRFRVAVADDGSGPEVEAIVDKLEGAGYEIGGEALKRAPRGYDPDHPRARLLRHKGLTMSRHFDPAKWMGTAKAADRIVTVWRDAAPLNEWLNEHVGQSELPER